MPFLRRNTAPPPTLPVHNGPSRVASCLEWMTTAGSVIFTERDEWKKEWKMVKYSASEHNKPFIKILGERSGCNCQDEEISNFMDQRSSPRGEFETQRVEAFCQGAGQLLGLEVPTRDQQPVNIEEPRAWVSDRNYWLLKDDPAETSRYGNVLGRIGFYNVLRKEVCTISSIGRGYLRLTHHSDIVRVHQERWLGPFDICKLPKMDTDIP